MKKWIVIIVGAILLLLGWFAIVQLRKQETLAENRYHIFCEKLVKGMSTQEVLNILSEFGEFEYGTAAWGESASEIFGNYADTSVIGQATVHIMFAYGKYANTYIMKFSSERGEVLCTH